jgi:hypothetical protein
VDDEPDPQRSLAEHEDPYVRFPGAKRHHLHPKTRNGPDTEFNLFPWNERSHTFWHKLFDVMSIREVWGVLDDAWLLIFNSGDDMIVPDWRAVLAKPGQLGGPMKPVRATRLRLWWKGCFGSTDLVQARRLLRYMMLFMVFGRYADRSREVFANGSLRQMLHGLPSSGDRGWAFRTCFRRLPRDLTLRTIKKIIRSVRGHARTIPIH